jgi:hypothetical protein
VKKQKPIPKYKRDEKTRFIHNLTLNSNWQRKPEEEKTVTVEFPRMLAEQNSTLAEKKEN